MPTHGLSPMFHHQAEDEIEKFLGFARRKTSMQSPNPMLDLLQPNIQNQ
jgi:hypothetical protein